VRNSIYSTGELASVYACFLLKSLLRISKRIRSIQTLEKGQNWGEGKFRKKKVQQGFVTGFFIAVTTTRSKILKTSQNKPELLLLKTTSQKIYRASRINFFLISITP